MSPVSSYRVSVAAAPRVHRFKGQGGEAPCKSEKKNTWAACFAALFLLASQAENEFGGGGRSSVNGLKVAVFGATGFLGRYVCNELGQVGSTVYIANRGCEMETRHLKPMFDLGNVSDRKLR